jgi:hypothetical protein
LADPPGGAAQRANYWNDLTAPFGAFGAASSRSCAIARSASNRSLTSSSRSAVLITNTVALEWVAGGSRLKRAEGAPEKPGSMREKESCADFGRICGVGKAVTNHHNAMYRF